MMLRTMLLGMSLLVWSQGAFASDLTIHAAELGIGKFHRMDNKVHPYTAENVWRPYVLASDAPQMTPQIISQPDGSVTIFFSHLEELLQTIVRLSNETGQKVGVFNLEAHGLPGRMWFPVNELDLQSDACEDWREAAEKEDELNYNHYYSGISKDEIMALRQAGEIPLRAPCTGGVADWERAARAAPGIREAFADGAEIHILSCLVGLGRVGAAFTEGLAKVLLTRGRVQTILNYGLGDWSMPEGLGFWDYVNDEQLERDNRIYVQNKSDRDIMQKGIVRVAEAGASSSRVIRDQDFMLISRGALPMASAFVPRETPEVQVRDVPDFLRVPGTNVRIPVR